MAPERDLFANFERMRREMDELFGDVFGAALAPRRRGGFSPAVDVFYADDPPRAVVHAELAGIDLGDRVVELHHLGRGHTDNDLLLHLPDARVWLAGDLVEDQALVKTVIDLGRTLGIEVMAEGVETDADRLILRSLDCMVAQGFLFSPALPAPEALAYEAAHSSQTLAAEALFDPATRRLSGAA